MFTAVIVGTIIFIALWIAAAAAINNYVQKDLTDEKLKEDYRS
jgi:heme O synthase-like polyprenyltransferase